MMMIIIIIIIVVVVVVVGLALTAQRPVTKVAQKNYSTSHAS